MEKFRLTDDFLSKYKDVEPPFGFNGLGKLIYIRTYSRIQEDGSNEVWWETVKRVVEGTYNMQKRWIEENGLGWNPQKAQYSAQEMYDRIFNMKFLPPGRGLWAMGSPITEERNNYAALFNCAYTSTKDLANAPAEPFCFLMDASMLGVGVGSDTLGAGLVTIKKPKEAVDEYIIPDTREGWVESVRRLLNSYFKGSQTVTFDYSQIRAAGESIRGFGGVASGPGPLKDLHNGIRKILDEGVGKQITKRIIADIFNMIGCSMSGIAQFISTRGLPTLKKWCEEGYQTLKYYDEVYSEWMCIPRSIKLTSVKPSGSVSLLAGSTPGIHYPQSKWYIRRFRLDNKSTLIPHILAAGYRVEECVGQEESTVVVEVPVEIKEDIRTIKDVSMWEQLALAAFMQRYWSDNQVSVTVTFDPETEGPQIAQALEFYQYQLKGVSFLPALKSDVFPQMPYEEITKEQYEQMSANLRPLVFDAVSGEKAEAERFCTNETCDLAALTAAAKE